MLKAISYLYSVMRNPSYRDFIDMGYGIDARYRRSNKYWDRHLALCKDFEARSLREYNYLGKAAILGAGSLLDIDLRLLNQKFSEILLYDANSSLRALWSKSLSANKQKVRQYFTDLTGSLEGWTKSLKTLLLRTKSRDAISDLLSGLTPSTKNEIETDVDVIFSINLLSQIPIYWRDRVGTILMKYSKIVPDDNWNYEPEIQSALEASMRKLQEQHLQILSASKAKVIVLITDSEFLYYRNSSSHWQSEKALYVPVSLELDNYKIEYSDSWFWHIAPQGLEEKEYGCIHNVIARSYCHCEFMDAQHP